MGRSFRTDDRGISPVIATIVLVAITVTAAGIIAAYVAGLYVPGGTSVLTASADGNVYDTDSTIDDNFANGKVVINVTCKSDDFDDVGDASEGLMVSFSNPKRGWSDNINVRDQTDSYGGTLSTTISTYDLTNWASGLTGATAEIKLEVPSTSGGELDEGMTLTLTIAPDSTAQNNAVGDNILWDEEDTINLIISSGGSDAVSLTGFDGAYLFGLEDDP